MTTWFLEKQTESFGIIGKVNNILEKETIKFQELEILETAEFGNMLLLDGMVMTS